MIKTDCKALSAPYSPIHNQTVEEFGMATRNANGSVLNEKVQIHSDGTKEYWRDVVNYEGLYRVSTLGRLKTVKHTTVAKNGRSRTFPEIIRKPSVSVNGPGYALVVLTKNGKQKPFWMHILVLTAFAGPCPEGMECRHFPDRSRTNNCLENISWGTAKENTHDKMVHGTYKVPPARLGEDHHAGKLSNEQVLEIRRLYATKEHTQRQLGRRYGVSQVMIGNIVRRAAWSHLAG